MSFRDHIVSCNNYDPARVVPLFAGGDRVGLLRHDNAAALRRFPDVFAVADDRVSLVARGDIAAVSRAVPAGAVSYRMETELGIRDDVLFVYDLETPADFVPKNQDGEIVHFELMPASAVLDRVCTSDDFKFNVNLVILDFALRHGLLRPDHPEYLDVATGLHRPLD